MKSQFVQDGWLGADGLASKNERRSRRSLSALFGNPSFASAAGQLDTAGVTPTFFRTVYATIQGRRYDGSNYDSLSINDRHVYDGLRIGLGQYLSGTCAQNNMFYSPEVSGPCAGIAGYYGDDSDLVVELLSADSGAVVSFLFYAPNQTQADTNGAIFQSLLPASGTLLTFLLTNGLATVTSMVLYIPPSPPPPSPPLHLPPSLTSPTKAARRKWVVPTVVVVSLFVAVVSVSAVKLWCQKREPKNRRSQAHSQKIPAEVVM